MTASTPLLTVVIPTLGNRPALVDAVASARPGGEVEVVVVVDADELEVDVAGDGVTVLSHGERRGVAAARNTGLAAARGSHVVFCDDDDVLGPDRVTDDLAVIARDPDVVRLWRWVDEGRVRDMVAEGVLDRADDGSRRARGLLSAPSPHVGCVTFPRDRVEPFDVAYRTVEDVEFWLRNQPLLAGPVDVATGVGYERRDTGGPRITEQRAQLLQDRLQLLATSSGRMTRAERACQWRRAGGAAGVLGAPVSGLRYFGRAVANGDVRSVAHAALMPFRGPRAASTGLWDDVG